MGKYSFQAEKPTRGDIYWIQPSQYRGNGTNTMRAGRPGVIVSRDELNENEFTYEIVFLTTTPKRDFPEHCTIRSSQKPSIAMCDQITTVSVEQLGSYIGTVTADEMASIELCMMISLGLNGQESPKKGQQEDDSIDIVSDDIWTENHRLKEELARAKGREEMLLQMYNELLAKAMPRRKSSTQTI